jgi:hypothetical protein
MGTNHVEQIGRAQNQPSELTKKLTFLNWYTVSNMIRIMVILALLVSGRALAQKNYRQEPCKTHEIAQSCVHIHGRLTAGNGTPSTRLWQIGTHHIYGIYSNRYGFIHDEQTLDNESPQLHFALPKGTPNVGGWTIYGDFEVCPLEPLIQGHMQAACIANADHVIAPEQ